MMDFKYQQQPPPQPQPQQIAPQSHGFNNNDNSHRWEDQEWAYNLCARVMQVFLILLITFALAICFATMESCQFLVYSLPTGALPEGIVYPDNSTMSSNRTKAYIGIYRYADTDNPQVCLQYKQNDTYVKVARTGIWISTICCCIALVSLLLEFCCCRFVCSRLMVNISLIFGAVGIPLCFVVFLHSACNAFNFAHATYQCSLGGGAYAALIVLALLVVSMIVSCITPKALPLVTVAQRMEAEAVNDPCCGCHGGGCGQQSDKSDYDLPDRPQQELPKPLPAAETVHIQGYPYKQYFDDLIGGVTLQSQYSAACQRWAESEKSYEELLDRFKQECQESGRDWKSMLMTKATLSDKENGGDETINEDDPELARLVIVLQTLRSNCERAKRVMDRIGDDLECHLQPPQEQETTAPLMGPKNGSVVKDDKEEDDDNGEQETTTKHAVYNSTFIGPRNRSYYYKEADDDNGVHVVSVGTSTRNTTSGHLESTEVEIGDTLPDGDNFASCITFHESVASPTTAAAGSTTSAAAATFSSSTTTAKSQQQTSSSVKPETPLRENGPGEKVSSQSSLLHWPFNSA